MTRAMKIALRRSATWRGQVGRFLASGLCVVALDYLVFIALTSLSPQGYVAANVAGKSAGALSGFFLHKHYTFAGGRQRKSTLVQLVLYFALYVTNMALSTLIIHLCVMLLGWNDLHAKVIADGIVIAGSFLVSRLLVFTHSTS